MFRPHLVNRKNPKPQVKKPDTYTAHRVYYGLGMFAVRVSTPPAAMVGATVHLNLGLRRVFRVLGMRLPIPDPKLHRHPAPTGFYEKAWIMIKTSQMSES